MPIAYRIDESRGLVITTATGSLTDQDILGLKSRLAADPQWSPSMRELSDVRAIDRLDVTFSGVQKMVWRDENIPSIRKYRLAIIAPQDHVFGMARMYEMLTKRSVPNVMVFREPEEALAWLAEPDAADPGT